MRLIDANVVIYAMGDPNPYKESCQRVFSLVYEGDVDANVDTELLQEVLHYYHRRKQLDFGLALFDRLITLFPDPFPITREVIALAADVLGQHRHLQARDALHSAVVLREGLEGIITADRGFEGVMGIKRFDPTDV